MSNLLYIIAVILVIGWAIGFVGFHVGASIIIVYIEFLVAWAYYSLLAAILLFKKQPFCIYVYIM